MASYLKKLERDLPRWAEAGWIAPSSIPPILDDTKTRAQQYGFLRLPLVLTAIGALILFAGIISLVASNWETLTAITKISLLFGVLGLSLLGAYYAREKQAEGISHALAFLSALIFGANIMLIAQIYHLPPNPPGGTLLWLIGTIGIALLWPSQLVTAMAFVLCGIWSGFTYEAAPYSSHEIHVQFLLAWIPLTLLCIHNNWTKALHVASLSLLFWIPASMFMLDDKMGMESMGLVFALLAGAISQATAIATNRKVDSHTVITRYLWIAYAIWLFIASIHSIHGLSLYHTAGTWHETRINLFHLLSFGTIAASLAFLAWKKTLAAPTPIGLITASLFLLCFQNGIDGYYASIILPSLTIAVAILAIIYGYRNNSTFFHNLGFALFAAKFLWIYFDTVWGLAARSGGFILGGLLIIGLGIVFEIRRRKLAHHIQQTPATLATSTKA